jgi:hypothetical protein
VRVKIKKANRHTWPSRGAGIDNPACPAVRHRHLASEYRRLGCRCTLTIQAYEADLELHREATRRYRSDQPPRMPRLHGPRPEREIESCPAERHRHSYEGYCRDGCRCPSTIKAYDRRKDRQRQLHRERRKPMSDPRVIVDFDLRRADRRDAEAIVAGYRLPRASAHTRGLAIKMMLETHPGITDRQIAWRLTAAGQGRMVSKKGTPPVYEEVSVRQVQRFIAALSYKRFGYVRRGGTNLDRSGRIR